MTGLFASSSGIAPLMRHQRLAVERALDQPSLGLAIPPGLGKTRSVLETIRLRFETDRWLVACPKRVAREWVNENEKWGCIPRSQVYVLQAEDFGMYAPRLPKGVDDDYRPAGAPKDWTPGEMLFRDLKATRERLRALISGHRLVVVTYPWVFWLAAALGDKPHFQGVVWDEMSFLKSKHAKKWQAGRRLGAGAGVRLGLDGTPCANGEENVWAPSYLLDGGKAFGRTLTEFRRQFMTCVWDRGRMHVAAGPDAAQRELFDARFSELWLPMRAQDWVELPDLIVRDVWVDLDPAHERTASALARAALAQLPAGAAVLPPSVAAGLNKAAQVCNGAVYDDEGGVTHIHDAKLDALEELAGGIEGGILVFYQFRHDADRILAKFGRAVARIDDENAIERWEQGKVKILLTHAASAGVGLNLQRGGNSVVWFGVAYDAFLYRQGNARVHRMGQASPSVVVYRILTRHFVERRQIDALDGKLTLIDSLLALSKDVQ